MSDNTLHSRSRHLIDPQIRPLLDAFPTIDVTAESLPSVRQTTFPFAPAPPEVIAAVVQQSRLVPASSEAADILIHIYRPKAGSGLPCVFHIHGGGYVAGTAAAQAPLHQQLVVDQHCVVVSVDYRLAPETPFPGPLEDCYLALTWLFAHADELAVDPTRIGVFGESAGGGLAAALALLARDRGEHRLAFQHLIYPMLDDRTCVNADPHPFTGEFVWTARSNQFGWRALLGCDPGSADVSPYASPAHATDLAGLPPCFISVGSLDLFLEEDMEYARRLMRAGVPCELHVYPGGVHGFDWGPQGLLIADAARLASRSALRRALHPDTAA